MPDPHPISEQVVAAFRAGTDRDRHFETIFRAYHGHVLSYFKRHGVDADQARDLAQEVFLVVYNNSASLREPAAFRSWLFGISRNKMFRHFEQLHRAGVPPGDENPAEQASDPAAGALENALDRERRAKLRDALEELPQQMRACVKLSVVEELEYAEIARRLGLSVNSVKVHIHRARRALAERLGPIFGRGEAAGE